MTLTERYHLALPCELRFGSWNRLRAARADQYLVLRVAGDLVPGSDHVICERGQPLLHILRVVDFIGLLTQIFHALVQYFLFESWLRRLRSWHDVASIADRSRIIFSGS